MNKFAKIKIKGKTIIVDKEMENIILSLNKIKTIKTKYCCSGHGKYPQTIICEIMPYKIVLEINSNTEFPKDKKYFYRKDKEGFYYIPEVMEKLKK